MTENSCFEGVLPDGTAVFDFRRIGGCLCRKRSDAQTITAAGTNYECLPVPSKVISDKQEVDLTLTIDDIDKKAHLSGNNGVIITQNTKSNDTLDP